MKKLWSIFCTATLILTACGNDKHSDADSNNKTSADSLALDSVSTSFEDWLTLTGELEKEFSSLDSIKLAYDESKEDFSQAQKDSAFNIYTQFMSEIQLSEEESYDMDLNANKTLLNKYGHYGYFVASGEGMYWLQVDPAVVAEGFKGDLSEELTDFIEFQDITAVQLSADAALLVSWIELGNMLTQMEDILVENTASKYYQHMIDTYTWMLNILFYGMDNTPTIAYDQPAFQEDVAMVFESLVQDEQHKTGKLVAHFMELMEENGYKIWTENDWHPTNDEVEEYLGIK